MKKSNIIKTEEEIIKHYRRKRRVIVGISVFLLILLYAFKNTSFFIRTTATICALLLFYLIDHLFDIKFRDKHYLIIIFILITSWMLSPLYYLYPGYDKVLHLIIPFISCSVVFYMARNLNIQLKWKLLFVCLIIVGFTGLHELAEYWLDYFFDLKLQGVFLTNLQTIEKYDLILDRIDDTMIDMTLGLLGAAVYGISRLIHEKIKSKLSTR